MLADKTRTGFYASSNIADKNTLFELFYLKWTAPNVDPELFNQIKNRTIENKKNEDLSPSKIFGREIKEMLRGEDYVTTSLTTERIERELKIEKITEVYKQFFGNANGYTIALISDEPFSEFREEVLNYIAALPSGKVSINYQYQTINNLEEDHSIVHTDGNSPKASVSMVYQQDSTVESLPDRDLENKVIKDIIRSRLLKELREELGAVYSVGVTASTTLQPSYLSRQSISFVCEPERVEELINITSKILKKLADEELSIAEDLEKIKTNLIKVDDLRRQRNTYWTKAIREHYFNQYENWNAIEDYQKRVKDLDEKEIAARIREYFLNSPKIEAVLLPKGTNF